MTNGSTISAAEAFDLTVVGRAEHGGQRWVVFDDGSYRHVVEESHFNHCGLAAREADDERRADDYTDWCHRGIWAQDDVAAEVAGLCGLTHVHSSQSGVCGRVDAVAARLESQPVEGTGWYVYVGGEDAGGPFETEADALEHWDN